MSYKFIQYITTIIKQYYNKQHYNVNNNIKTYKIVVQSGMLQKLLSLQYPANMHMHTHVLTEIRKSADTHTTCTCTHTYTLLKNIVSLQLVVALFSRDRCGRSEPTL